MTNIRYAQTLRVYEVCMLAYMPLTNKRFLPSTLLLLYLCTYGISMFKVTWTLNMIMIMETFATKDWLIFSL